MSCYYFLDLSEFEDMFIVLILPNYVGSLNETVFGETDTAMSFKEIRQRDPYGKPLLSARF